LHRAALDVNVFGVRRLACAFSERRKRLGWNVLRLLSRENQNARRYERQAGYGSRDYAHIKQEPFLQYLSRFGNRLRLRENHGSHVLSLR